MATVPTAVTVTTFVGRAPGAGEVCILVAEERFVDVPVGEQVGGRPVIDGAA